MCRSVKVKCIFCCAELCEYYLTWLSCIETGYGGPPPEFFLKNSVQNPAIRNTSYELIGLHVEVHCGGTIRGIPECIKICIIDSDTKGNTR